MNKEELYPTDELIEKAVNTAYPSKLKYRPTPADYLIAKYAVDSAAKKIMKHLMGKWIYHYCDQISGEVLLMEDVIALKELIKDG